MVHDRGRVRYGVPTNFFASKHRALLIFARQAPGHLLISSLRIPPI